MRRAHPDLQAAGLSLALVGMGSPEAAAAFAAELALPYPVLTAPDRAAYRAYRLVEAGVGDFLAPAAVTAMTGALLRGHRASRRGGDPRQLGGAFLIDRAGIVRWAKPERYPGDVAAPGALRAASRKIETG